jgi:hypothetical protein
VFGAQAQRTTGIGRVSGSWAAAALARSTARDGHQLLSPSRGISAGRIMIVSVVDDLSRRLVSTSCGRWRSR